MEALARLGSCIQEITRVRALSTNIKHEWRMTEKAEGTNVPHFPSSDGIFYIDLQASGLYCASTACAIGIVLEKAIVQASALPYSEPVQVNAGNRHRQEHSAARQGDSGLFHEIDFDRVGRFGATQAVIQSRFSSAPFGVADQGPHGQRPERTVAADQRTSVVSGVARATPAGKRFSVPIIQD
jgi:hypothetical protein